MSRSRQCHLDISRGPLLCRPNILQDIFLRSHEDFALPEGDDGEDEEDDPSGAHEDDHSEVPNVKPAEFKNVAELLDTQDPTDVREGECPA